MDEDELRDAFAGLAMQTLMAKGILDDRMFDAEDWVECEIARRAYAQADAMLKVRRERNKA